MRRATARRLAALERRLLPPPKVIWSAWQRVLTEDEYAFVLELDRRGADNGGDPRDAATWYDDWPAWRGLCVDERELALLDSIRGKGEVHGLELWGHLHDLRL